MISATTAQDLDKRPNEPVPEQFGLTAARFRQLDSPEWGTRLIGISVLALFLIVVVSIYEYSKSAMEAVGFAVLFPLSWVGYIFIPAVVWLISSTVWRRAQRDYKQYLQYKQAILDYKGKLEDWFRRQLFWWQNLDGRDFEMELGLLFIKLGYEVSWTGKAGDGGVDLALSKDGRSVVVQCKAHGKRIGPAPVRDLFGTMIHKNASEAWLISTMGFSKAAMSFASGKSIRLLSIEELLRLGDHR